MYDPGVRYLNISEIPCITILIAIPQVTIIKHIDRIKIVTEANFIFDKKEIPEVIINMEKIKLEIKLIEILNDGPTSSSEIAPNNKTVPI